MQGCGLRRGSQADRTTDRWAPCLAISPVLPCPFPLCSVPLWLQDLPNLRLLDVSGNNNISLSNVTALTQLETLVLQQLDLSQPMVGPPPSLGGS